MKMLCLGIEGTAHTFGVGIVDPKSKVLANRVVYPLDSLDITFGGGFSQRLGGPQKTSWKDGLVAFRGPLNSLYITFDDPPPLKQLKNKKHLSRLGVRMTEISDQGVVVEEDIFSMFPAEHRHSAATYRIAIELRQNHGWGARKIGRALNVKEGGLNYWFLGLGKPRPIKAVEALSKIKLIPLRISSSLEFLQFVRVFGLRYGDGCISHQRRNHSITCSFSFHDVHDAELFCEDIRKAWGLSAKILPGPRAFYVFLPASIGRLLACAGAPIGKMTKQIYRLPQWVFELTRELKWEFIDALFSADGSAPSLQSSGTCCKSFGIALNSEESHVQTFRDGFMTDIWQLLSDLCVSCSYPKIMWNQPRKAKDGQVTYPVKIGIFTAKRNALYFLQHVSFRYCKRKAEKAGRARDILKNSLNIGS